MNVVIDWYYSKEMDEILKKLRYRCYHKINNLILYTLVIGIQRFICLGTATALYVCNVI